MQAENIAKGLHIHSSVWVSSSRAQAETYLFANVPPPGFNAGLWLITAPSISASVSVLGSRLSAKPSSCSALILTWAVCREVIRLACACTICSESLPITPGFQVNTQSKPAHKGAVPDGLLMSEKCTANEPNDIRVLDKIALSFVACSLVRPLPEGSMTLLHI